MPQAQLALTIPEGIWIGDLSRRYPEATVRVLAAMPDDETGVGLVEVLAADLESVVSDLSAFEDLPTVDVLQATDERALVRFETTAPLPLLAAREAGIPIETPFEICDGEIRWEITAPHEQLSELSESLEAFGIPFRVESIQTVVPDRSTLLTDQQLRIVTAGVDAGYYDTPRRCSLTELAEELGLAKSTASETLHRAEESIVKEFVESVDETAIPDE